MLRDRTTGCRGPHKPSRRVTRGLILGLALIVLGNIPAQAADAVLTIYTEAKTSSWYDRDYTFTLYDDGTLLVETSFGLNVGEVQIPPELIPPGTGETEVTLTAPGGGAFPTLNALIMAVANRLFAYLVGNWSAEALFNLINGLFSLW